MRALIKSNNITFTIFLFNIVWSLGEQTENNKLTQDWIFGDGPEPNGYRAFAWGL